MAQGRTRILKPGVYAPLPTFFDENQELDYGSYQKHLLNLAMKGMVPVCAGSLGEAVHLSFDERTDLIRFIRATLDEAGLKETPIVAGVGGLSTRETISLARAAAAAGADAGMVILPAYYAASLNTDANQIIQYYVDICEASPIPILLYNFPSNAGGLDMSSSTIQSIMERSPNLCGVKLTCGGSISKLIRLTSTIKSNASINSSRPFPFLLLDGLIADLTPWMQSGGHGTVSGIPNFAPVASMRLWELLNVANPSEEEVLERENLQGVLSRADVAAVPAGVRGMKYVLNKMHGYGKDPRRPLLPLGEKKGEEFMGALGELLALEREMTMST
ncbi:dihydrodipicolinate synthase family protein [Aspergillus ibericus CBS 121593]|uniref:Putative dihydrodipicolinate synthase n=1 Tax=Aspergillus ibericus CBS 121593 TaxID=1448316 RepID=A0A395GT81_9EURO|nr:putative dihydrodipicolinate synthase [Aspergillus ibericus CBS 121593]RAK98735.1 putative dihydrodipicolinate synthase [Aspergillus ibericus CBS 121593]